MGFNLGDVLAGIETDIPAAEGREQLEYINIEQLDGDPKNFYELSGIEELAASIELIGLQQPIRVRTSPDDPARCVIVSGHRRVEALRLLVAEGKETFRDAPCIREAAESSAALQELRLIYANSDTRKMTNTEITRQAERVEALLYELKEQGVEFPGRMRDHVAEACKVSKSKLQRLKAIQKGLTHKTFKAAFEKGELTEGAAIELAKLPEETQRIIYDLCIITGGMKMNWLTDWRIKDAAGEVKRLTEQNCSHCSSGKCENARAMLDKRYQNAGRYSPCTYKKCCADCEKLTSCKTACPKLADSIQQVKAKKKDAAAKEKAEQASRDAKDIEAVRLIWERFGKARKAANKSVKTAMNAMDRKYGYVEDTIKASEDGQYKFEPLSNVPYGYMKASAFKPLLAAADCFGCSVDYLLGRTTVKKMAEGEDDAGD